MQKKEDAKAGGGGMFKGLIDTIIGNLQLSISNVHIRYEVSTTLFSFIRLSRLNSLCCKPSGVSVMLHAIA